MIKKKFCWHTFITIIYDSQSSLFAVIYTLIIIVSIISFCEIINHCDIENIYFESEFNEWFRPDLSSLSITTS
jgi:PIN domain nuclease of toxin-antitoxin system